MGRGESKVGVGGGASLAHGKPNEATEYYVSGEGMWINQYLRGRGDFGELSENEKQYLKDLDIATDGKIKDKTLYRSVDATALLGRMDDFDYSDLRTMLTRGENAWGKGDFARQKVENLKKIISNAEGKRITEKGFMSTTSKESVASEWSDFTGSSRPVVMRIKPSSRTRGVDLSVYDKNVPKDEAQHERLLARNQSYVIKKVYSKNMQIYIDVEME